MELPVSSPVLFTDFHSRVSNMERRFEDELESPGVLVDSSGAAWLQP
jgi:hypothetical protein